MGEDDKKTLLAALKESGDWLSSHPDASKDDIDEQKAALEAKVNPITSKLYASGGGGGGAPPTEEPTNHDEL